MQRVGKGRVLQTIALIIVCFLAVAGWSQRVLGVPLAATQTTAADFAQGSSDGGMTVGDSGDGEVQTALEPVEWGNWTTSVALPQAIQQHAAVVVAGRIYVIGGFDGLHALADVSSASLDANGDLGAWSSAQSLPQPLRAHGAVYEGGYIFVVGGLGLDGYARDSVYSARVNSDGSLSQWRDLGASARLPRPLSDMSVVVANGYLVVLGGWDGSAGRVAEASVYVAPVRADGSIGPWQLSPTALPRALRSHRAALSGDYLYLVGGSDGTSLRAEVYRSQVSAEGEIGPWTQVGTLPHPLRSPAAVAAYGYLHVLGGETPTDAEPIRSTVYAAHLGADGSLGPWLVDPGGPLPAPRTGHQVVAAAGYLYLLGGASAFGNSSLVARASVSPSKEGLVGAWSSLPSSPCQPFSDFGAVVLAGSLFVAGGEGASGPQADVCSLPLSSSGQSAGWRSGTTLPLPLADLALAASPGYLYAVGGRGALGITNTVYLSAVGEDGLPGPWIAQVPLPTPLAYHRAVAVHGSLYVFGGFDGRGFQSAVYRAEINADGTLGSWMSQLSMPTAVADHAIAVWDDHIYIIGGQTAGSLPNPGLSTIRPGAAGTASVSPATATREGQTGTVRSSVRPTDAADTPTPTATVVTPTATLTATPVPPISRSVFVGSLGPDGSLDSWVESSASLPQPLSGHAALVANRYLIVAGGRTDPAGTDLAGGYVAGIKPDGGLAGWFDLGDFLPQPASGHSIVGAMGSAVALGARSGPLRAGAQIAPLAVGVSEGRFTHSFDLGGEYLLSELQLDRVVAGAAEVSVRYRVGAADGSYGAWSTFSASPIVSLGTVGRYLEYQIRVRDASGGYAPITAVRLTRGANYVKVLDDQGHPVQNAVVVRNRKIIADQVGRPLLTNADGVLSVDDLRSGPDGDVLMAMLLKHEEPSAKGWHQTPDGPSNWSYRVFTTSASVTPDGGLRLARASAPGEQRLVIDSRNTLILFNLVVSLQWPAASPLQSSAQPMSGSYGSKLVDGLASASDLLFDATDGQLALGSLTVYDSAQHWDDADIQILASNQVAPHSDLGGLFPLGAGSAPHTYRSVSHYPGWVRLGRLWDGFSATSGTWDLPNGYRGLVKALGAYALGLDDEHYFYSETDGRRIVGACTGSENRQPDIGGFNASLMDWPYAASELAARGTSQWDPACMQTRQWQTYAESDWETLVGLYADNATQPSWLFKTPVQYGPNPGPSQAPVGAQVTLALSGPSSSEEEKTLLVTDGAGSPLPGMQVFTQRTSTGQLIDQGVTDSQGRIGLRGVSPSDKISAVSWDGQLQGSRQAGYDNTLRMGGAPWSPRVVLTGESTGDHAAEMTIKVYDVAGAASAVIARVTDEVGNAAGLIRLESLGGGQYSGTLPLSRALRGGYVLLSSSGASGQSLEYTLSFRMGGLQGAAEWVYPPSDPASSDGNLLLHIPSGALSSPLLVAVTTGSNNIALGPDMIELSPAYAIQPSMPVTQTTGLMNLAIRYKPDLIPSSDHVRVSLFKYDDRFRVWNDVGADIDQDEGVASTLIRSFGTYAVFGTSSGVSSLSVDRFQIKVTAKMGDETFDLGTPYDFQSAELPLPITLPYRLNSKWTNPVQGQSFAGELHIRVDHIRPAILSLESFTGSVPGFTSVTLSDLGTITALGADAQSFTLTKSADVPKLGWVTFTFQVDVQSH